MNEQINGFEIPTGSILLEPREYHDQAIIGFDKVVLYDYDLLIESFIEQGFTYDEAIDWISYNTIRTGEYIQNFPKIITTKDNNNDRQLG